MSAARKPNDISTAGVLVDSVNSGSLLLGGIRSILRCDEAEVVQGIAQYVINQYPILRVSSALVDSARGALIPGILALLGCLRASFAVRSVPRRSGGVWIARLINERSAIEPFLLASPDLSWNEVPFGNLPDRISAISSLRNMRPRRITRMARRLHRRHEFFKVLRVAELIGYYRRYVELLQQGNYQIALTSNHSNPHGVAFNLAARKLGVPVVLVTHGMPVRPVARLSYDLAVVHCAEAHQTYRDEGCQLKQVLIHGRREHWLPMPSFLPQPFAVGLFLCKDVNEARMQSVVGDLLRCEGLERLLIRPHPKNLWRGLEVWIASLADPRIVLSSRGQVIDDIRKTDIVLGGNSSVLIDAVVAGRLAGFVAGLDYGPPDLHSLVARGLIFPIKQSGQELVWEPSSMLRFYQRDEWPSLLKAFANIDEAQAEVVAEAITMMRRLARDFTARTRSASFYY